MNWFTWWVPLAVVSAALVVWLWVWSVIALYRSHRDGGWISRHRYNQLLDESMRRHPAGKDLDNGR